MKRNFKNIFFAAGWVLLVLFLASGYFFNKFSGNSKFAFAPISWGDHLTVFEGALSCNLTDAELVERKLELKKEIFPKLKEKEALEDGFIYYFDDEPQLAENITEFILKEKQCCPFFKFDFSILPFKKGLALRISGSEGVKDFLVDLEKTF